MSGLITLVVAVASAVSCDVIELQEPAPDAPKTLQDGEYVISITSPDFRKDQRKVSHRIRFNVDAKTGNIKGQLIRTFDGERFPPVPVHGVTKGQSLRFAVSGVEDGSLMTLHFSGKLTDAENASGSCICFRDLEKVFTAKWDITKPKK